MSVPVQRSRRVCLLKCLERGPLQSEDGQRAAGQLLRHYLSKGEVVLLLKSMDVSCAWSGVFERLPFEWAAIEAIAPKIGCAEQAPHGRIRLHH